MHIYRCRLILHEPLFFATREIGRLYETGRYLHNYALTHALKWVEAPWFNAEQVPRYAQDLAPLNGQVYVTPATPEQVTFQLATFKYGEEQLHVEMQQAERNTPSFGRAKELAPESTFVCYVLSEAQIELPRWIRLGKWHSKALVETQEIEVKQRNDDYVAACALNPLDVPPGTLRAFDIVSMPPSSLVANARCGGEYYEVERGVGLPMGMAYRFG
jgi:CRISPR-associated protein Csc1